MLIQPSKCVVAYLDIRNTKVSKSGFTTESVTYQVTFKMEITETRNDLSDKRNSVNYRVGYTIDQLQLSDKEIQSYKKNNGK